MKCFASAGKVLVSCNCSVAWGLLHKMTSGPGIATVSFALMPVPQAEPFARLRLERKHAKSFGDTLNRKVFTLAFLVNPVLCFMNMELIVTVTDQFVSAPFDTSGVTADPALNIPCPISEGVLYDVCEIFRGSGNWTQTHVVFGLTCHDGFDIDSRRLRVGDLQDAAMFHELVGLALRRVVRDFHAGIPCFGAFRRPEVRSNSEPLGFDTSDPFTAYHDRLAQRTAFILTIALLAGAFISVEQPRNSRLYRLHCSKVLLQLGCVISHVAFCCYGSAFHKPSKWLHNKPWLCELESKCSYNQSKGHFKIEGSFTKSSVEVFRSMCKPSCETVYGVCPKPGDAVAAFSAAYPRALVSRMASGLLAAKSGQLHP